jgi:hypothetical protein
MLEPLMPRERFADPLVSAALEIPFNTLRK